MGKATREASLAARDSSVGAFRLGGRVAIVTGGASGIGEATVYRLAAEGAAVMVADIDQAGAERVAATVVDAGGQAGSMRVDVRSRAEVQAVVENAVSRFGRLDVMHNNAGIASQSALAEQPEDEVDELLDVNLKGVINGLITAGPVMMDGGGGSIINTASVAADSIAPNGAVYSATKAGVCGITRAAAWEFAPHVRVNAISPGGTRTPMNEREWAVPSRTNSWRQSAGCT